jgi:hypothetical protein
VSESSLAVDGASAIAAREQQLFARSGSRSLIRIEAPFNE